MAQQTDTSASGATAAPAEAPPAEKLYDAAGHPATDQRAVLEATILATRTRFLPREHILAELERLQVIVDKTAGPQEHAAMAYVTDFVRSAFLDTGDRG